MDEAPAAGGPAGPARLRAIVAHAHATVPLYRERFDAAGIKPADVRSLADLAHLPVLTRAELEAADPARKISSIYPPATLMETRTSGSSGRPLTFHRDPYDHRLRKALFVRALHAAGFRLGQRMLLLARAPRSLPPAWMRWHYAGRDPLPETHLAMWEGLRPRAVYGMASPLRGLAELLVRQPAPRHRAALVFCTGETLDSASRRLLEQGFGGQVFDIYGSSETGTAAYECAQHAGLHLAEDAILTELLPLPGSDAARLIVTSLVSRGTPLIRYEIGDLAVAGPIGALPLRPDLPPSGAHPGPDRRLRATAGRLAGAALPDRGGGDGLRHEGTPLPGRAAAAGPDRGPAPGPAGYGHGRCRARCAGPAPGTDDGDRDQLRRQPRPAARAEVPAGAGASSVRARRWSP